MSVERLAQPATDDPSWHRLAFGSVVSQALMETSFSPLSTLSFDEWWDRHGQWLWQGWPEDVRPHPSWVPVLRMAVDRGPEEFEHPFPSDWDEGLQSVMAVWLRRSPETILPLLDELIRPDDYPKVAFIIVNDYLERGPFPLTPEIDALLDKALPFAANYDDETAEWLVHALHTAGMDDGLIRLEATLREDQAAARRELRIHLSESS